MLYKRKVTAKYILPGLIILVLTALTFQMDAKDKHFKGIFKSLTDDDDQDTTRHKQRKGNAQAIDTVKKPVVDTTLSDSIKKRNITDTLTFSKDSLDAPVAYKAEDSAVLNIPLLLKNTSSNNDKNQVLATILVLFSGINIFSL